MNSTNHFSSLNDTLIIRTKKIKGGGLFGSSAGRLSDLTHVTEKSPYTIKYPKNVEGIKRFLFVTDFKNKNNYVDVLRGVKNGKKVFIVDENNNNDLSDDRIRSFKKLKFFNPENLGTM